MRPEPKELVKVPLFASLSADELQAVAILLEHREEPPGAALVGEGAPGYSLFVLQRGEASVTSDDQQIAELGPGDFFGEIALLTQREHTATVRAITSVELLVMHGSDFRVFERDWPDASALMKRTLAKRLARSGLRDD
jgi:voltage-gated potassium channel